MWWVPFVITLDVNSSNATTQEYGLRDLPTVDYPDKTNGVTLKCSKLQEAVCFYLYMAALRVLISAYRLVIAISWVLPEGINSSITFAS